MRRKKQRFADISIRKNVVSPEKDYYSKIKGKWKSVQFNNNNPIILELACGKGEYTIELAKSYPKKNFVGVDIKGDRIWVGSTQAIQQQINNASFLRTDISKIDDFFSQNEVSEIWITFPDPQPKKRNEKKRLTNSLFLDLYKKILTNKGWIHLKTDNPDLFSYSLVTIARHPEVSIVESTYDLYHSCYADLHLEIKTKYEKIFTEKGHLIKYLRFQFK